jgi:hypothetical protein
MVVPSFVSHCDPSMSNVLPTAAFAMILEKEKFGYLFVGFICATTLYGVMLSQVRS